MGLMISGKSSEKEYNFGYSGLHQIRWIACRSPLPNGRGLNREV